MKHMERYYLLFPQNALQILNVDIICNCNTIRYSYSLILFVYLQMKELFRYHQDLVEELSEFMPESLNL